jgi:hypothetical protein
MPGESKIDPRALNLATFPISLSDYLRTSFHPDCDFVDGEVVARILGEFEHAAV